MLSRGPPQPFCPCESPTMTSSLFRDVTGSEATKKPCSLWPQTLFCRGVTRLTPTTFFSPGDSAAILSPRGGHPGQRDAGDVGSCGPIPGAASLCTLAGRQR